MHSHSVLFFLVDHDQLLSTIVLILQIDIYIYRHIHKTLLSIIQVRDQPVPLLIYFFFFFFCCMVSYHDDDDDVTKREKEKKTKQKPQQENSTSVHSPNQLSCPRLFLFFTHDEILAFSMPKHIWKARNLRIVESLLSWPFSCLIYRRLNER